MIDMRATSVGRICAQSVAAVSRARTASNATRLCTPRCGHFRVPRRAASTRPLKSLISRFTSTASTQTANTSPSIETLGTAAPLPTLFFECSKHLSIELPSAQGSPRTYSYFYCSSLSIGKHFTLCFDKMYIKCKTRTNITFNFQVSDLLTLSSHLAGIGHGTPLHDHPIDVDIIVLMPKWNHAGEIDADKTDKHSSWSIDKTKRRMR